MGYESDYDKASKMYSNVKTDFYGNKHNSIMGNGTTKDPHEHFGYSPKTGENFWHGTEASTRGNHPGKK